MITENKFTRGLSSDVSYVNPQTDTYLMALDLRPYNKAFLSEGSLMNFKGTAPACTLPDRNTEVIGSVEVKDGIVVFTVNMITGESAIWRMSTKGAGITLIYSDDQSVKKFDFDINYRIHGVSKRDSEFSERVYWTDGKNQVRAINILETFTSDTEADYFDIYPTYTPADISIELGGGAGNIETGKVQYFVMYFNKYGSESAISGWSDTMILTKYDDNTQYSFKGADKGESSNRSVNLHINNIDDTFTHISVYRILYTDITVPPQIRLVAQTEISGTSMFINDSGNNDLDE